MTSRQRSTHVQMPADPALHPAHVVAIRPDVDGALVRRGDYVLSVGTPKGARNVVAPADGVVQVNVSLMEDLEPNAVLFSVAQAADDDVRFEVSHAAGTQTEDSYAPGSDQSVPAAAPRRLSLLHILFFLACMALAVVWPGMVFSALGGEPQMDAAFAAAAAILGLTLLIPLWLVAKISFLAGSGRSAIVVFCALLAFAGALAAGVWHPPFRTAQKQATAPAAAFIPAGLGTLLQERFAAPRREPAQEPRQVTTLPTAGSAALASFEPLVGDIILVGFTFCPRGWAAADGQLLPISQNDALFSLYGTYYGGDGRSTFGLPDLRGRAPVHVGEGPGLSAKGNGQKGGSETVKLASGSETIAVGRPYLAMKYCIALTGIYPSRN